LNGFTFISTELDGFFLISSGAPDSTGVRHLHHPASYQNSFNRAAEFDSG
jgi:hypothetical protein